MASELESYYAAFSTGFWAVPEESDCPCHGGGWALSEVDTWHQCPIHFAGQPHSDDFENCETEADYEAVTVRCRAEWEADQARRRAFGTARPAEGRSAATPQDVFGDDDLPF